jgi:flagellar motility protein MotE (MotC chaperone)
MTEVTHLQKNLAEQKKAQGARTQNLESNINKRLTQLEQHLKARLKKIEGKVPYSKSQNVYIRYKIIHKITNVRV